MEKKNLKIIFRPHPSQDLEKVKKRFKGFRNIIITKKYSITPWIIASDLYIHSGCTTAFEAQKLKKKIIFLNKSKNNETIMKIGEHAKNFSRFFKIVNDLKKIKSTNINLLLKREIHNFNDHTSFVNIFLSRINKEQPLKSNVLKKNIKQKTLEKFLFRVFSKLKEFKIALFIFQFFLHPKYLLSKKYKETKLNFIKKKEICYYLDQIYNKHNYKIKSLDKNIFLLTKIT